MIFWEKFKETLISVIPIMILVLILNFTIAPLGAEIWKFLVGGLLLILGLSIFLLGVDIGILPMGQRVGAELTVRRSLPLMLGVGFLIGFFITVAEPDVQVLATQVTQVAPNISSTILVVMIGLGVGFFVAVAMGRIVLQVPLRLLLFIFYLIVFACAYFTDQSFLGIAFDAGGATTGPMTVPFIMALGVGVAGVRGGKNSADDSFGLVGLASIGPILAVLILGIVNSGGAQSVEAAGATAEISRSLGAYYLHMLPEIVKEVALALGPLILMFAVFILTLTRMTPYQMGRLVRGLIYSSLGLILFFLGVKGGFMSTGSMMGGLIASYSHPYILLPLGLVIGAMVVLAEPAVWVLTSQVEEVSGGHIRKNLMLISLSAGVAVAVGIAMLRVLTGLSIWYFIIPGYGLALLLTLFCPKMFTAIAFDSGGVASGPMASTFILSFTLGASGALGGNPITDAFGVIAMIAMTPLIAIQVLGILFDRKQKRTRKPFPAKAVAPTTLKEDK